MHKHQNLFAQILCGRNINYYYSNGILCRTLISNKRFVHLAASVNRKKVPNSFKIGNDRSRISRQSSEHTEMEQHKNDSLDQENTNIHPELHTIIDDINRKYRVMICMRGAPGSGKSHLARTIVDRTVNGGNYDDHIFSTDDYFYDRQTKQYNFDPSQLRHAHISNNIRVGQRARDGWSPIIIDNTNMKLWEMFAYVREGIKYGYLIKILQPNTTWAHSSEELTLRNKHNVDRTTIERMLEMYEKGSVTDLLNALNLQPTPPRLRKFPKFWETNHVDRTPEN